MNGRVEDPIIGRFLSADPLIDGALDSQGWNRYSYVTNNPGTFVDGTGFNRWCIAACWVVPVQPQPRPPLPPPPGVIPDNHVTTYGSAIVTPLHAGLAAAAGGGGGGTAMGPGGDHAFVWGLLDHVVVTGNSYLPMRAVVPARAPRVRTVPPEEMIEPEWDNDNFDFSALARELKQRYGSDPISCTAAQAGEAGMLFGGVGATVGAIRGIGTWLSAARASNAAAAAGRLSALEQQAELMETLHGALGRTASGAKNGFAAGLSAGLILSAAICAGDDSG